MGFIGIKSDRFTRLDEEWDLKHDGYLYWRTFKITSPHWQEVNAWWFWEQEIACGASASLVCHDPERAGASSLGKPPGAPAAGRRKL